jgi:hypothetical protein
MKNNYFTFRKGYWWCNWIDYSIYRGKIGIIHCPYCKKETADFYFPPSRSDSVVDDFLNSVKCYCIGKHNDCGNYIPMAR